MKRRFILTSMFLSAVILVYGQRSIPTDYKGGNSIGLQMDAFDFMAKGFSIWCNYTSNYNRIFLDVGRNELPDFLNPLSDDFVEKRKYFIQTGYYRFLDKPNGFFVGVELIFQRMEISSKSTNEIKYNDILRIGPALGYEWIPFKSIEKFSITPWISERLPLNSKEVVFPVVGKNYKTADFNFVMGCNIGFRLSKK